MSSTKNPATAKVDEVPGSVPQTSSISQLDGCGMSSDKHDTEPARPAISSSPNRAAISTADFPTFTEPQMAPEPQEVVPNDPGSPAQPDGAIQRDHTNDASCHLVVWYQSDSGFRILVDLENEGHYYLTNKSNDHPTELTGHVNLTIDEKGAFYFHIHDERGRVKMSKMIAQIHCKDGCHFEFRKTDQDTFQMTGWSYVRVTNEKGEKVEDKVMSMKHQDGVDMFMVEYGGDRHRLDFEHAVEVKGVTGVGGLEELEEGEVEHPMGQPEYEPWKGDDAL